MSNSQFHNVEIYTHTCMAESLIQAYDYWQDQPGWQIPAASVCTHIRMHWTIMLAQSHSGAADGIGACWHGRCGTTTNTQYTQVWVVPVDHMKYHVHSCTDCCLQCYTDVLPGSASTCVKINPTFRTKFAYQWVNNTVAQLNVATPTYSGPGLC